jgi:hypothetical protein
MNDANKPHFYELSESKDSFNSPDEKKDRHYQNRRDTSH